MSSMRVDVYGPALRLEGLRREAASERRARALRRSDREEICDGNA